MYITITDIGLGLDIVGAILVFRFAILKTPPPINRGARENPPPERFEGQLREDEQLNPDYTQHKILSLCGISLLVIGFVLQMVGVRCPAPLLTLAS